MLGPMAQPTIRLGHTSITGAKYSQPCRVFTQAMSANHAMLGPSALNLRPARSSAESRLAARFSPEGRLAHARVAPRQPRSRMMRAKRFIDVRTPMRFGAKNAFSAPYMPRTSALTWEINSASSSSRSACALGGRLFHA